MQLEQAYTPPVTGEKLVVVAITSAYSLVSLLCVFFLVGLAFLFPFLCYLRQEGCCGIIYAMHTYKKDFNVGSLCYSAQVKVTVSLFVLLVSVSATGAHKMLLTSLASVWLFLFLFDCFFLC